MTRADGRITELEVKLSFQERQLEELNGVILRLREDVERIKYEMTGLGTPRSPHPPLTESPLDL